MSVCQCIWYPDGEEFAGYGQPLSTGVQLHRSIPTGGLSILVTNLFIPVPAQVWMGVHLNKRDCRCCTFDCVPTCTNTVEFNTDYKNELPRLHKVVVRRFFSFEVTVEIIEICIKMKNLSLLAFISFRVSQHIDSAANNDMLVVQLSSKDATSTLSHVVASCP